MKSSSSRAVAVAGRPSTPSSKPLTRRRFLGRTGSLAASAFAFTIVPRHVLGGPRFVAPSEKVNVALVGAGGQGRENLKALFRLPDVQVIAVADAAEDFGLEDFYYRGRGGRAPTKALIEKEYGAKTPNHKCAAYEDFRELLEKEKAVDAVVCATPDHLHAYVSVLAMKSGRHMYCEKPLTHNIWEARRVAEVARETGVATQMGNIGHSLDGMRMTCEYLAAGAIGAVKEVHAWVGATRWNKELTGRPEGTPPVPAGLNWDLWLGPREKRPFHPAYFPVRWRDFWAFGGGALGDFICHDLDAACWALDLKAPHTVHARPGSQTNAEITPHSEMVYWDFAARGTGPHQGPVRAMWYDGGLRPPVPEGWPLDQEMPGRGCLFVGDKGTIMCAGLGGKPMLLPEEKNENYKAPAATIPRSKGHHRDWIDACKGGPAASSHFEYGARLTELLLLGVLSLRTGKPVQWDSERLKAKNNRDADAIIKESYRSGWEVS